MDKPLSYYAFEMLYWCGIQTVKIIYITPLIMMIEVQYHLAWIIHASSLGMGSMIFSVKTFPSHFISHSP